MEPAHTMGASESAACTSSSDAPSTTGHQSGTYIFVLVATITRASRDSSSAKARKSVDLPPPPMMAVSPR